MKAVSLVLALATSWTQAPIQILDEAPAPRPKAQIQGRTIRVPGGIAARGVSAFLPVDGDGNRYYYSRSTAGRRNAPGFSETTIESWSGPDGRPLRARYFLDSAAYVLEIKLTINKADIVFDETLVEAGKAPKTAHVAVPIPADTLLQLSQFNPMDLPLGPNGAVDFTLVDPVAKRADRVRLVRLANENSELGPETDGPSQRFRIDGPETWTEIELAEDGQFQRMANGKGYLMLADGLSDPERQELHGVLTRARKPTSH